MLPELCVIFYDVTFYLVGSNRAILLRFRSIGSIRKCWLFHFLPADHENATGVSSRAQVKVVPHLPFGLQLVIISLQGGHRALGNLLSAVEAREDDQNAQKDGKTNLQGLIPSQAIVGLLGKSVPNRLHNRVNRELKA